MVGKSVSTVTRRRNMLVGRLAATFVVVAALAVAFVLASRFVFARFRGDASVVNLYRAWESYDYQNVYDISTDILRKKTFNNAALMLHGYAAFFLSLSATDTTQSQDLLDESINALRLALLTAKDKTVSQLEYMLGKAYFYKDTFSSYYYYADLAVRYLTRARRDGYQADDIPEFLGLSYASLDMTMESISAFTEALLVRESDLLLLSIAEQYYKAGQSVAAGQYLYRISQDCKDEKILLRGSLLHGQIALEDEKYAEAEKEFQAILEKNENSADAYYYLGVLYEKQGDSARARSQWRRALRVQPNHSGALKKMADFR
ncbi:MAG: tetratricopeptide repeat protein [Treponema sp.]|nr:tetratricopeptide repeat protein [Treponema sp.]